MERLLEVGFAASFHVVDTQVSPGPDDADFALRIELRLGETRDDQFWDDVEWVAHGFLFAIATLSFADARPRDQSVADYREQDTFTVADFFDDLRFRDGALCLYSDYVRGRRMKTDVAIRPGGEVTIQTFGRGMAAQRWLDRIQGKALLDLSR